MLEVKEGKVVRKYIFTFPEAGTKINEIICQCGHFEVAIYLYGSCAELSDQARKSHNNVCPEAID